MNTNRRWEEKDPEHENRKPFNSENYVKIFLAKHVISNLIIQQVCIIPEIKSLISKWYRYNNKKKYIVLPSHNLHLTAERKIEKQHVQKENTKQKHEPMLQKNTVSILKHRETPKLATGEGQRTSNLKQKEEGITKLRVQRKNIQKTMAYHMKTRPQTGHGTLENSNNFNVTREQKRERSGDM